MAPGTTKRIGAVILATSVVLGCGDDGAGGEDAAACPSAACPGSGSGGSAGSDSGDGASTQAPATDDAPGTGADTSAPPDDTTGDASGPIACDPANAMFTAAEPPAMERASIQIDPDARTCAARGTAGDAPQIVLEVRQTGMVDAVTYGIEVTDSTLGVVFTDSSEGDSQVTQLPADLPITITGTLVDGGAPITIDFEIFSTGPTLIDVAVELG